MNKDRTFAAMRERGFDKIDVTFSGGNDEGGIEGITAFKADGTEVEIAVSQAFSSEVYDTATQKFLPKKWIVWEYDKASGVSKQRDATLEEIREAEFVSLLDKPIDEAYGGFAGDFSVYGTVTWDAVAKTCIMDRNEQSGYDNYTEEF